MLWRDHGGIINITYGINDLRLDAGDWTFVRHNCVDPAAAELAWSAPQEIIVSDIGDFFFNNKPIRLDNGEWLIPVTIRTRPSQGRPYHEGFYAVGALVSSDEGNTWKGFKSGDFEKSGYGPKDICVHEAGATGENRTDRPRIGLTTSFCAWQFRQQENLVMGVSDEVLADATPELLDLIGFRP